MTEVIKPFRIRLKEALEYREMRAVDLCKKTNISQSTMSQYISGYAEPKKERLNLIATALNINPTWLMGLDVSMEPENHKAQWSKDTVEYFGKTTVFEYQLNELGWNCEFIGNFLTQESYYVFSNGKLSFNVSSKDYHKFVDDSRNFFKVRIHTLLKKSTQQMFTDNSSACLTDAAHALPNTTTEDKLHDEDIMNDDNF